MSTQKSLSIIFGGEETTAALLDGSSIKVRVRALPARYLGEVLAVAEKQTDLIELCTSIQVPAEGDALPPVYAGVRQPEGWVGVPIGWTENLSDESHEALYQLARQLNFTRAAAWGKRQIAAKKDSAPIIEAAHEALRPIIQGLLASTNSALTSGSQPVKPPVKSSTSSPSPS
jgi:hypothetical protein